MDVRNALINLVPDTPTLTLTVGGNNGDVIAFKKKNQGNEFPCEKITVSGTCPDISTVSGPESFTVVVESSIGAITKDPRFVNPGNYNVPVEFTTNITVYPYNGSYEQTVSESYAPLISVLDRFIPPVPPNPFAPIQSAIRDERKYYDSNNRLWKEWTQTSVPLILITTNSLFVDASNYLVLYPKTQEITDYVYALDGTLESITKTVKEAKVSITDDVKLVSTIDFTYQADRSTSRPQGLGDWLQGRSRLPLGVAAFLTLPSSKAY